MGETENERWKRVMGGDYRLPNLSPEPQAPSGNAMGVRVKLKPEGRPRFERTYTAALTENVRIKITCRTFYGSNRSSSGELTQSNGRYVLFDPERVADKILDPRLIPLVEVACEAILSMDREWIRSRPSEFTDESGAVWRRV